jgi:hypothetical protein
MQEYLFHPLWGMGGLRSLAALLIMGHGGTSKGECFSSLFAPPFYLTLCPTILFAPIFGLRNPPTTQLFFARIQQNKTQINRNILVKRSQYR